MTHEDFLNDMYCFYSMNPEKRAFDANTGACSYKMTDPDGTVRKCAVGRWIPD